MAAHNRTPSVVEQQVSLERRSITVAAIRRGEIKISDPVPLEYSGPSPVWTTAVPEERGDAVHTVHRTTSGDNLKGRASLQDSGQPNGSLQQSPPPEERVSHSPPEDAPPLRRKRSSQCIRPSLEQSRQEQAPGLGAAQPPRTSMIESALEQVGRSASKRKRRSGSIRNVFRKMFGRRDKAAEQGGRTGPPRISARGHEYHQSVRQHGSLDGVKVYVIGPLTSRQEGAIPPGTALSGLEEEKEEDYRARETSGQRRPLTEEEYRDHSSTPQAPRLPFPMNVNAPEQSPPYKNYISFETSPQVHRRRATLPSLALSPADAAALNRFWAKRESYLSPHSPEQMYGTSRADQPPIGMAITSGANPNRRSRSATALREIAQMREDVDSKRRRSAEIEYWRTTRHGIAELASAPTEPASGLPSRPVSEAASVQEIDPEDIVIIEPSESSRSKSTSCMSDALADTGSSLRDAPDGDMGSIDGISPVENLQSQHIINPMELRLSHLEFNMHQLERHMAKLKHVEGSPDRPAFTLERPPSRVNRSRSSSRMMIQPTLPSNPKDALAAAGFAHFTPASESPPIRPSTSPGIPVGQSYLLSPSTNGTPHTPFPPLQSKTGPSPRSVPTTESSRNHHHHPSESRIPRPRTATNPRREDSAHSGHTRRPPEPDSDRRSNSSDERKRGRSQPRQSRKRAAAQEDQMPPSSPPQQRRRGTSTPPGERIERLQEALRYERTSRMALESQVAQLQRDVHELAAVVHRMGRTGAYGPYPTPSPDESFHAPPYQSGRGLGQRGKVYSRFSGEMDDDEYAVRGHGHESGEDEFVTPGERGWDGDGEEVEMF